MNSLGETIESVVYSKGHVLVSFESGLEIRFPVAKSPRLATASEAEFRKIEISPFGLHWPDLDEDLSFAGLLRGDYGQQTQARPNRVPLTDWGFSSVGHRHFLFRHSSASSAFSA